MPRIKSAVMNSCYDGFCDDYRVKLKLNSSFELTVEAEQRRTHQIYRETFENEKCAALTVNVSDKYGIICVFEVFNDTWL